MLGSKQVCIVASVVFIGMLVGFNQSGRHDAKDPTAMDRTSVTSDVKKVVVDTLGSQETQKPQAQKTMNHKQMASKMDSPNWIFNLDQYIKPNLKNTSSSVLSIDASSAEDSECFCFSKEARESKWGDEENELLDLDYGDEETAYDTLPQCIEADHSCNDVCEEAGKLVIYEGALQSISYCGQKAEDMDWVFKPNEESKCVCMDLTETIAFATSIDVNYAEYMQWPPVHSFKGTGTAKGNLMYCYAMCPMMCALNDMTIGGCAMKKDE